MQHFGCVWGGGVSFCCRKIAKNGENTLLIPYIDKRDKLYDSQNITAMSTCTTYNIQNITRKQWLYPRTALTDSMTCLSHGKVFLYDNDVASQGYHRHQSKLHQSKINTHESLKTAFPASLAEISKGREKAGGDGMGGWGGEK